MSYNNKNNNTSNDATGEVISWVIVFIMMFAFWPVGLILLFRKLSGYAKNGGKTSARTNTQTSNPARQAARQAESTVRQAVQEVGASARQAAQDVGATARQAASQYKGYVKQSVDEARAEITLEYPKGEKKKSGKKKDSSPLDKKSGKFVSVVLILISLALFIIGANTIANAAQDIWGKGLDSWRDLWMGAFYFIGAFISFFSRNIGVKRISRYKNHFAFVAGRGIVSITDIARASGLSVRAATRDVQAMVNEGHFGPYAYIDSELDSLVLYPEAAAEARDAARSGSAAPEPQAQTNEKPENQYMAIIQELRDLNITIVDIPISDKIDRIEELTAKIFRIVEDNPEKLPQIRRFMNYYLPTTLKLLRSYATLEKQGIKGENITATKENIGRILDTLATGYEQQLDQLFKSDAIDIASDIDVLENMMQQDGLTGNSPELKVMESN